VGTGQTRNFTSRPLLFHGVSHLVITLKWVCGVSIRIKWTTDSGSMKFVAGNDSGLATLLPCLPKCVSLSQSRTSVWGESFLGRKDSAIKEQDLSSGKPSRSV
jgi:hypothetical protein